MLTNRRRLGAAGARHLFRVFGTVGAMAMSYSEPAWGGREECSALNLDVSEIVEPPTTYREFCRANPDDCRLTGSVVSEVSETVVSILERVNREVNAEIRFVPDFEVHGEEEYWCYPTEGQGDCEDIALEKRRRLIAAGLPSASMTMAIVHHKTKYYSHAVLVLETSQGTWVMDSLADDIPCWSMIPYYYEIRERPDGRWDRYDQSHWWKPEQPAAE